ncbi:MAG: tRNA dihydrouridine synthase DusB [Bacteroidetes bacterium]|nr:tRNA dihydrouridine synthase DusB [Bacteroidota bacterium]
MVKIADIPVGDFPLLLAPMEDVSDPPFRKLCKTHGADVMYTEFISSSGLIRDAAKSVAKLDIFEYERPIGIQIFGNDLEEMQEAAAICEKAGPDIIDINFGCPVKKVAGKGSGAGILKDIPKMVRLTEAIVKAVDLPVTVKTRLGWDANTKYIVDVAARLQDVGIQALSIHGRTRAQMYKGEADWGLIGEVKNNPHMHIPIFGNGDVNSPEKVVAMKNRYGVDGIMIGRAAIGYPWIFNEIKHFMATGEYLAPPSLQARVDAARQHLTMSIAWKGDDLGRIEMRRHYGNYFRNFPHFKPFRMALVTSNDSQEVFDTLDAIVTDYAAIFEAEKAKALMP